MKVVFINEVKLQSDMALFAYKEFEEALKKTIIPDIPTVFFFIHSFLIHAANVSKLFWPNEKRDVQIYKRGEALLKELEITKRLDLSSRRLRNHLEHYDERLEKWAVCSKSLHVDMNIMPKGSIKGSGINESNFLRNLDQTKLIFSFQDDEYSLKVLADEVKLVNENCRKWLKRYYPRILFESYE